MMPGMDGFETLEEIRKENSLPILMFTSKNDSASKVRGLRAGADDYLTKPFDMDEYLLFYAPNENDGSQHSHNSNHNGQENAAYDEPFSRCSDAPYHSDWVS